MPMSCARRTVTVLSERCSATRSVAGLQHGSNIARRLVAVRTLRRLGPFHAVQRDNAGLPDLADGAAELAAGLEAHARRLVAGLKHHGHAPRRNIRQRLDVGELDAPIA